MIRVSTVCVYCRRSLLVALLLFAVAGCGSDSSTHSGNVTTTNGSPNGGSRAVGTPSGSAPIAPPAKIPEVVLTAEHQQTCVVKQGDRMPERMLPDLAGQETEVPPSGGKLSVVVFWNADNRYAETALGDLADIADKHPEIKFAAVHLGEATDKARSAVENAKPPYPVVVDADRKFYELVANDPGAAPIRLFLLDGERKVLWFAIDYSNAVRKEFESAVEIALAGASK